MTTKRMFNIATITQVQSIIALPGWLTLGKCVLKSLVLRPILSFLMSHAEGMCNIEMLGMGLRTRLSVMYSRSIPSFSVLHTEKQR